MVVLQPGHRFGAYHLVARISRGGMGEVWRATKLGPDAWSKAVALKVILPTISDEERFAELFLAEARIAAALDHSNIVPVFAYGRDSNLVWLEMELVEGHDLNDILRRTRGGLPLPLSLFVAAEALKGLQYAHERRGGDGTPLGLVHRDIKPHNVLISHEGAVKLSDFGIAKVTAGHTGSQSELKGTVGYISPEVLDGGPASQRSDLFGIGLVVWECLTGRKLFDGNTEAQRIKLTLDCRVPSFAEVGVTVPAAVDAIVRRLLARDPDARYPTAAEVLSAVLAAPGGREATSVELKAFLARIRAEESRTPERATRRGKISTDRSAIPVEIRDDPQPEAQVSAVSARARRPGAKTGTMAGEARPTSLVTRINRTLGSRGALIGLGVVAALSIAAALSIKPRPRQRKEVQPTAAASPTSQLHPGRAPSTGGPDASPAPLARSKVIIEVEPPRAKATINGDSLPGSSPYLLDDVLRGSKLVIHAESPGYVAFEDTVWVDAASVKIPIRLLALPPPRAPLKRTRGHVRDSVKPPAPSGTHDEDGTILPEQP